MTRWVILGSTWRQPMLWTSTDGRTWDRRPAEGLAEEDRPREIAAVPEGFVLVGTDTRPRPTAWTSADGLTWTKAGRRAPSRKPAAVSGTT